MHRCFCDLSHESWWIRNSKCTRTHAIESNRIRRTVNANIIPLINILLQFQFICDLQSFLMCLHRITIKAPFTNYTQSTMHAIWHVFFVAAICSCVHSIQEAISMNFISIRKTISFGFVCFYVAFLNQTKIFTFHFHSMRNGH